MKEKSRVLLVGSFGEMSSMLLAQDLRRIPNIEILVVEDGMSNLNRKDWQLTRVIEEITPEDIQKLIAEFSKKRESPSSPRGQMPYNTGRQKPPRKIVPARARRP